MVKGSNERAISSIEAVLRDLDRIDLILLLLKITLVITGDQARWIRHRTATVPATKPPSLIPFGMPLCYAGAATDHEAPRRLLGNGFLVSRFRSSQGFAAISQQTSESKRTLETL